MAMILDTWREFSLSSQVRLEPHITAVFRDALIAAYVAAGRSWFVELEAPVTDPTFGTELGRNDLRFYPPEHHGQTIFFTVECKRLHVTTDSGFRDRAAEYVEEGMRRFVDGTYSSGLPCGAMLGYVMDNRLNDAFATVRQEIRRHRASLTPRRRRFLKTPSSTLPSYRWSADTFHQRADGELRIHHLLVGLVDSAT